MVILPLVFFQHSVLCVGYAPFCSLFVRHWCFFDPCLVSFSPCIILSSSCASPLDFTLYYCAVRCRVFSTLTLCPMSLLFPFSSFLSNAQRARTVCIMYCIQPRKDMMNSSKARWLSRTRVHMAIRHSLANSSIAAA